MSARAIATATVSFGLVSIPVKLYSSGEPSAPIRFNMLHKDCGSRLKQQYLCQKDNSVVSRTEMVKGYEFAKGQYVTFTPEELKALEAKATQSIEITEFLPTTKVDPIYFEKSYYLGPDKGGDRAYKLLAKALNKAGRSAVATYAARGKQYLVLLRPFDGGLVMQQLRYANEVRAFDEVPLGDATIKDAELKLAMQIIDQGVSETFKPGEYEDDVRKRIEAAIQEKVDGKDITATPEEEPKAQVIDLMEALKASIGKADRKPARRGSGAKIAKVAKTARKRRAKS